MAASVVQPTWQSGRSADARIEAHRASHFIDVAAETLA